MNRFFRRLGEIIESKYLIVITIAVLLMGVAFYGASRIKMDSGMGTILPADSQVMGHVLDGHGMAQIDRMRLEVPRVADERIGKVHLLWPQGVTGATL